VDDQRQTLEAVHGSALDVGRMSKAVPLDSDTDGDDGAVCNNVGPPLLQPTAAAVLL
jgi:hypothetical protein